MSANASWGILDTKYQRDNRNPSVGCKLTEKLLLRDNVPDDNNNKKPVMARSNQEKISISEEETNDTIISDVCLYLEVPRENIELSNPRDFINKSLEKSLKSFSKKMKK